MNPCNNHPEFQPFNELRTWLEQVDNHSHSSSKEDRESLSELATRIPVTDKITPEIQMVIDSIKSLAAKNMYDPEFPAQTNRALLSLKHLQKPSASRKLF